MYYFLLKSKQGKDEFPKPSEFNNKAVNLDIGKRQKLCAPFLIKIMT